MKKFIYSIGFILCCINLSAQNKEPFLADAKKDFVRLYYSIPFGNDFNWFERFNELNKVFYSLHSEFVVKHFSGLKNAGAYKDDELLIAAAADSINTWFMKYHAMDSVPNWWGLLKEVLPEVSDKVCDCIYKAGYTEAINKLDEGVSKCYRAFLIDASLVAKLQAVFKGRPMGEMKFASSLISQYVMINCKPLYVFSKRTASNTAVEQFGSSLASIREEAMDKIVRYARSLRHIDSLNMLFPLHKKFETDITALKVNRGKLDYIRMSTNTDGTWAYTYTFFKTINKKSIVTSQVVVGFDTRRLDVVVNKLQFIERSKIKGLIKIEKELNEDRKIVPAPPVVEKIGQ
jgi:hypothetical protein